MGCGAPDWDRRSQVAGDLGVRQGQETEGDGVGRHAAAGTSRADVRVKAGPPPLPGLYGDTPEVHSVFFGPSNATTGGWAPGGCRIELRALLWHMGAHPGQAPLP
jgi:hypothetical protein